MQTAAHSITFNFSYIHRPEKTRQATISISTKKNRKTEPSSYAGVTSTNTQFLQQRNEA